LEYPRGINQIDFIIFTAMSYEFNTRLLKVNSSLGWNYHFIIPKDISAEILKNNRRVICEINNVISFQCGLFPKGKGIYFINLNKENRKKLDGGVGDEIHIKLSIDNSKYGMSIPSVFEELLLQDPDGEKYFHALTPGKQRNLLYIIGKPKSERIQLEKGIVILEFLKSFDGKIDFRGLNEALKKNRYR